MQSAETFLVQQWVKSNLVFAQENNLNWKSDDGWGNFDKKLLLIALSNNIENDSVLLKKVIGLTENFSENDFYFLPKTTANFSLNELTQQTGATKIFLFGFSPAQCGIFLQGITDEPFQLQNKTICFLPIVEKCVADVDYKKRFAAIWLNILQTKWKRN